MRHLDQEFRYTGDEAFLHQLFLIFLDNAIKYSPEKSVLHVSLEEVDGMIRVRFRDHGIGIAAKHLPFIFERFYRAAPSNGGDSPSGRRGVTFSHAHPPPRPAPSPLTNESAAPPHLSNPLPP